MIILENGAPELTQYETRRYAITTTLCTHMTFWRAGGAGATMPVIETDNGYKARIPDNLIANYGYIEASATISDGNGSADVVDTGRFYVRENAIPENYAPDDYESPVYQGLYALIRSMQSRMDAGEFIGETGPVGPQGDPAPADLVVPAVNAYIAEYLRLHPEATIDEDIIRSAVNAWLANHPEYVTTVMDNSISAAKLTAAVRENVEAVPGLKQDLDYLDKAFEMSEDGVYAYKVNFERGGIDLTTGADKANNYRLRSSKIYFGKHLTAKFDLPAGYDIYYLAFDADGNVIGKTNWITPTTISRYRYRNTEYARIMVQVTGQASTLVPLDIIPQINITANKPISTAYVSVDGSDYNEGTSEAPFATVQHAIDMGIKDICIKNGVYFNQSVKAENISGLTIYASNDDIMDTVKPRERPVFINAKKFTQFSTDSNGHKYFTLSDMPGAYKHVFINHDKDPIISGSYPSYNAQLWSNHVNKFDDIRLKPVLTYAELSENNTFYFDGTKVYFNSNDTTITGVSVGYDVNRLFEFSKCDNLTINGIELYNSISCNLYVVFSNNVHVSNCVFGYTMVSNSVSTDYSNITFDNCEAFKATIDGFNAHKYGVSTYNNCKSSYNYDDGESSHEYCEIIVNGGEYSHNAKGGHAPVNGCKFTANGTYTHHNGFGFYCIGGSGYELSDILITNSAAINNVEYDVRNTLYDVTLLNCVYGTSHIGADGGTITDLNQVS